MTSIPCGPCDPGKVQCRCARIVLCLLVAFGAVFTDVSAAFAVSRHSGAVPRAAHFTRPTPARASLAARRELRRAAPSRSTSRRPRTQFAAARQRGARELPHARRREHVRLRQDFPRDARDFASLPHRIQRMSTGGPLPAAVPRQVLVFLDQDQTLSVGAELARRYGLEQLSSDPLPLLHARAELMRIRGKRSLEDVLAALQRDPRVRSAQPNQRYLHTAAKERYRHAGEVGSPPKQGPFPQYAPRKIALPEAHELALGLSYLDASSPAAPQSPLPETSRQRYSRYAQALLATNEFMFVD